MFHKNCQITFRKSTSKEKVKKCHTPLRKNCDGNGPERCNTVYETSCTTRYVPKSSNQSQLIGDTQCEKFPIKVCGRGCQVEPEPEVCQDQEVTEIREFRSIF